MLFATPDTKMAYPIPSCPKVREVDQENPRVRTIGEAGTPCGVSTARGITLLFGRQFEL